MNTLNGKRINAELKLTKRNLMKALAAETLRLFKIKNFEVEGFINSGVEKWKEVKTKKPGEKIGVDSGRMKRTARSRVKSSSKAVITFHAPYSGYFHKIRRLVGKSAVNVKRSRAVIEKFYMRKLK